ncbi:MAG: hypothetical protein ACKOZU_03555 [Planctomycetaceae bacterium]
MRSSASPIQATAMAGRKRPRFSTHSATPSRGTCPCRAWINSWPRVRLPVFEKSSQTWSAEFRNLRIRALP